MKKKPFILLVDDDKSFLEIVSLTLKNNDFNTETAIGADDGLKKAETLQPDFVLSDIVMDGGPSGWEFAFALIKNPGTRGIKIAFLTSLGDPWREYQEHYAGRFGNALEGIQIFDKCDIDSLGDRLHALIATTYP